MTDWSKAIEVFVSGIVGVFAVMAFLQILTQLSTRIIDLVESWQKGEQPEPAAEPKPQVAVAKEKA